MTLLILAFKSFVVAGAALLLLRLLRGRSATDRSLVAHLGLGAVLLLPVAWLSLPQFEVASSWVEPAPIVADAGAYLPSSAAVAEVEGASVASELPKAWEGTGVSESPIDWLFWLYTVPAALLIGVTLVAVLRLVVLKARANVLVESGWLTALAQAQRRMGFKSGTALLTSDELRSPISWGLVRPVILLNSEAAEAREEAEAIIAHELAHVANFDWAKLLIARVAVAIFWFNPLVWLLAREAHQLREEAADDAVLASNIEDVDYAQLLVGIARHECRGLLIGAHGVAPARDSLARRVKRVLDRATARAPGGWRWSAAAGFFAAGMAFPLAALQLVPAAPVVAASHGPMERVPITAAGALAVAGIGEGAVAQAQDSAVDEAVATESQDAAWSVPGAQPVPGVRPGPDPELGMRIQRQVYASLEASGVAKRSKGKDDPIDRLIEMRAVGVTPEYVAAIRKAAPHLKLSHDDIVGMAAVGVTPGYISEMQAAGVPTLDADELVGARAVGISAAYVREMSRAGYGKLTLDQLQGLRALNVTPADISAYRRALGSLPSLDRVMELKAIGITPEEVARAHDP